MNENNLALSFPFDSETFTSNVEAINRAFGTSCNIQLRNFGSGTFASMLYSLPKRDNARRVSRAVHRLAIPSLTASWL